MFVDASAIVSILLREDDASSLAVRLHSAARRMTSAIAVYEAVLAIVRLRRVEMTTATALVDDFVSDLGIRIVPIGVAEAEVAIDAFSRFGKGRHPAGLNMGDCFAYACARSHGAKLLFKGDDFGRTDVERG